MNEVKKMEWENRVFFGILGVIAAIAIALTCSGCLERLANRAIEECRAEVEEAEMVCYGEIQRVQYEIEQYCSEELSRVVDEALMELEAQVEEWLLDNGCVDADGAFGNQWDCSGSPICGG